MQRSVVGPRTGRRLAWAISLTVAVGACSGGPPGPAATGSVPGISAGPSLSTAPGAIPTVTPEVTPVSSPSPSANPAPLSLTSPAFGDGASIPAQFTCKGADGSPALAWEGVPQGTGALVLVVDDPDARDFVHWTVLDFPATETGLAAGVPPSADTPQQGRNDFGKVGYGGPCPPSGTHRYHFTLYALATPLGLQGHPDGRTVRAALAKASVLARSTLTGTVRA